MNKHDHDNNVIRVELDTIKSRHRELLANFQKVNRSRDTYMRISKKMMSVIIDMLLSSRGWSSDIDIDKVSIDIINEYNDIRNGDDR